MQKKPITNKLLWIFAVGQFGWSPTRLDNQRSFL